MKSSRPFLRAVLFDFDGVLANTEPIHCALFQKVLSEEGILLSEKDYYEKYLGLDDRGCFSAVYHDQQKEISFTKLIELIRRKNAALLEYVKGRPLLLPGVIERTLEISKECYLAIVSGALKSEILAILQESEMDRKFQVIVAADDVSEGKPNPEGFLTAVRWLNRDHVPPSEILLPQECLVIEDSPWGIEAAHRAGMKCLAVKTSYSEEKLSGADKIVASLEDFSWKEVESLF